VYFGFAKKWEKVPWIAFEHYMDKGEAEQMFGKAIAAKMVFNESDEAERDEDGERKEPPTESGSQSERKTCLVYEIWKKEGRKVCFFSDCYLDGYLKEEDDPLELSGFYPMPKPIAFLTKTNDLTPSALYLLYENQAKELNRISVRINRIVEAIKIRGAYDGSLGDTLDNLLKGDDNTMIATDNASNIALQGGLDKYIWFMPLDQLVGVLQQLIVARNECKQIIYEVTGLSDIIRGASNAQETATAQSIKNQWGSLRIKMAQQEVRRFVRDMLRMMLEVAAKKFSVETFAKMTGLPFVTQAAKQQAQALLAAVKQQMAAMPPAVGPNGQPMPAQIPPALQQTMQQAQQTLAAVDWESVIALLQDDLSRSYRIDIETNSTVQVDEQEDKSLITEAMGAMGQFLKGVTPLVEAGIMPFDAAKSMLLSIVRRFRFGTEVEEEIKSMQPPKPQGMDEATQKAMQQATQAKDAAEKAAMGAEQKAMQAEAKASEAERKLAAEVDERKLLQRQATLDVRELKLAARESELAMNSDSVKVQQSEVKQAASAVTNGIPGIAQVLEKAALENAEFKDEVKEAMTAHVEQTRALIAEVMKAVSSPRRRTPVRGPDGRITEVRDEMVPAETVQPTMVQ